jgi:hypothetical protein
MGHENTNQRKTEVVTLMPDDKKNIREYMSSV